MQSATDKQTEVGEQHDNPSNNLTVFTGFIGFAAFAGWASLYILKLAEASALIGLNNHILVVIAAIALLLLLASRFNDLYLRHAKNRFFQAAMLLCGLLGSLGLILPDYSILCELLFAVAFVLFALVWGNYLSTVTHHSLLFVVAASFAFAGLIIMFSSNTTAVVAVVITVFLMLLSWFCYLIIGAAISTGETFDRKTSIKRNHNGLSNRFTLVNIGVLLGAAISILEKVCSHAAVNQSLLIGASIAATGVVLLVLMSLVRHYFETLLLRVLAILTAVLLLPLSFVPSPIQIVLACLLVALITTHFITIVCAIAETARFNMVSYVWLFGCELFFLFLGTCLAAGAFIWVFSLESYGNALLIYCIGTVIVSSVMQVFVQSQSYPQQKDFDTGLVAAQNADNNALAVPGGNAIWHKRINVLAAQHELSPRQCEVLEILVKGRDTSYIMERFVISRATAKTHVYNLYKKLGVHSRQELLDLVEQSNSDLPR